MPNFLRECFDALLTDSRENVKFNLKRKIESSSLELFYKEIKLKSSLNRYFEWGR